MKKYFTILFLTYTFLGISFAQTKSTRKITIEVIDRDNKKPLSDYLLLIFNERNDTIFNRHINDTSDNILELRVNHVYSIHIQDSYVLQTFRTSVDLTDTTKNLEYFKRIGVPRRATLDQKGFVPGLRIYMEQPILYFSDRSFSIKNQADSSIIKYVKICQEVAKEINYRDKIEYRIYCTQTPFEPKGTASKRGATLKQNLIQIGIDSNSILVIEKNDSDFQITYNKLKLKEEKEYYKARNRSATIICIGK